jgi:hypothetical protein
MAELLDGVAPYAAENPIVAAAMHLKDEEVPLGARAERSVLAPVIRRAVRKDTNARFHGAVEMADAIRGAFAAVGVAVSPEIKRDLVKLGGSTVKSALRRTESLTGALRTPVASSVSTTDQTVPMSGPLFNSAQSIGGGVTAQKPATTTGRLIGLVTVLFALLVASIALLVGVSRAAPPRLTDIQAVDREGAAGEPTLPQAPTGVAGGGALPSELGVVPNEGSAAPNQETFDSRFALEGSAAGSGTAFAIEGESNRVLDDFAAGDIVIGDAVARDSVARGSVEAPGAGRTTTEAAAEREDVADASRSRSSRSARDTPEEPRRRPNTASRTDEARSRPEASAVETPQMARPAPIRRAAWSLTDPAPSAGDVAPASDTQRMIQPRPALRLDD